MDAQKKIREHISALGDGELASSDLELAAAALGTPDGELAWISYHRIGDVLRAQAAPEFSPGFDARLRERLAAEPPPLRRAPAGGHRQRRPAEAPVPATGSSTAAVAASVGGPPAARPESRDASMSQASAIAAPVSEDSRESADAVVVRPTSLHDWPVLKALRLAALADAPTAFGVSLAEARSQPGCAVDGARRRHGAGPLLSGLARRPAPSAWRPACAARRTGRRTRPA